MTTPSQETPKLGVVPIEVRNTAPAGAPNQHQHQHQNPAASGAAAPSSVVMTRLREETAQMHKEAETRPFQLALMRGQVTREQYASWLSQMWIVHRALDAAMHAAAAQVREIRTIVTPEQYQEGYLAADLDYLGVNREQVKPLPATTEFVQMIGWIATDAPLLLLGIHYVLEGSKNGNKFIARAVRPALGLTKGTGDRYLDTYGEQQPALWAKFKADMGAIEFTSEQVDGLVAAAKETFKGVTQISEELMSPAKA